MDSADREVRRLIRAMVSTVEANGGFIHPELVVHHEGPDLWMSLPRAANPYAGEAHDRPAPAAPPVLAIPSTLHVPVTKTDWPDDPTTLRFVGDRAGLSGPQRDLLGAMVDLFNACDKVREIGHSYPQVAMAEDPDLQALIREVRPSWGQVATVSPAQLVLESRLRSEMGGSDEGPLEFLMPMIDMINHHPYGSRYETDGDAWVIRAHHPVSSDQIFVRYNKADSLGIALDLGYVERATRFVSSVACEVDVPDVGIIDVVGVGVSRRRLPAPRAEPTKKGMRLDGLELGMDSLHKLRDLLSLPIRVLRVELSNAEAQDRALGIIRGVAEANQHQYLRLAALPDRPGDLSGLRPLMREVAEHQLGLLAGLVAAAEESRLD